MEDDEVCPSPVKRERLNSEVVADHQRVCVIQRPKQRIELMSDDEQNSAYYCKRGPVLSENSINNILKVVSLQSFSSSRAQQSNNEVNSHRSELGSDSPLSSIRSSGESSPSSEDSNPQFTPIPEIERNASRKGSSRRRGEKVASSMKDDKYWEKRLRNNASAKRSRDARRVRELECQIRSEFMEEENRKLEEENKMLREENARLSKMIQELKSRA
ncbi:hepatic leukemia factor [Exaiptasia diaphana]|uniref:BZIP domain-containing protein n=1 Tax=Exaiptasia diaphana TaxID=2652724 RepID=A0A913X4B8_EXADI|nr:hepatic leukemia factor [Exaiptasia diaphana]KXJ15317.1 Hepatic leukemia factor [Exaiptasia diaphana]